MHEVSVCDLLPAQFNVSLDHVDTLTGYHCNKCDIQT